MDPKLPSRAQREQTAGAPENGKQVMILAVGCLLCMAVGLSTVVPIVPMLAHEFEVPLRSAGLVITAFTLPGIFFAPVAGIFADRYGRKAVLLPALIGYCLTGVACGFAPDLNTLIFLRFFQGLAAAPLGVLNTTLIADVYSGPQLARMIGLNMTVLSICTAISPFLGGFLYHFGRELPFFLPGLFLVLLPLALKTPLGKPAEDISFAAYLKGLAVPFRNRRTLSLFGITLLTYCLLYGPLFTCFPAMAHDQFSALPGTIGAMMIFSSIGTGVSSVRLSTISTRFSSRRILFISFSSYTASLLLMPHVPALLWAAVPIFLYGMGQGMNIPTVQTELLQSVPASQRGSVMSVNSMLLRLGQSLGPVTFSTVIERQGIALSFYTGIVITAMLAYLAYRYIPEKEDAGTTG